MAATRGVPAALPRHSSLPATNCPHPHNPPIAQKPFKYVCHVSLTQRCGAGMHAASCQRNNPKTDGGCRAQSTTCGQCCPCRWVAHCTHQPTLPTCPAAKPMNLQGC